MDEEEFVENLALAIETSMDVADVTVPEGGHVVYVELPDGEQFKVRVSRIHEEDDE